MGRFGCPAPGVRARDGARGQAGQVGQAQAREGRGARPGPQSRAGEGQGEGEEREGRCAGRAGGAVERSRAERGRAGSRRCADGRERRPEARSRAPREGAEGGEGEGRRLPRDRVGDESVVLISVSVNATTGNGHGRHADDVIPVEDGSCDRAQPGPVPEPEDPTVPPKEDPKPNPAWPGGDEPRLPVSQREVLAAESGPAVQDELPFTGLPLPLLALLGATAAVAGGLLRRNRRSSGRTTRLESR